MIQRIIRFLTRPPGVILPIVVAALFVGWYVSEQRTKNQRTNPGVQRELGQVKPAASVAADKAPQAVVVEDRKLAPIQGVDQAPAAARNVPPGGPPSRPTLPTLVSFYTSAVPTPTPPPPRKRPPQIWLPRGIFIPCELVNTIESSHMDTPVVGEVLRDVYQRNNGVSHLIIPAGTLVNCFSGYGRVRDRIEVKGTWSLTFPDGLEYELQGVACTREADPELQQYGVEDGSAGLQGDILYTGRYAELKAFGAAALAGVAQGFQTVQGDYYGGQNLQHTPQNAGLQGLSNVMELLVQKYMNANDGDETYVRVLAGKQFYIYPTTVIQPDQRSVGAKDQREQEAGTRPSPSPSSSPSTSLSNLIMELERKLQEQQPQQVPQLQQTGSNNEQPSPHMHY
jgi:Bacterial conjugation TrbI-like protein